MMRPVSRDDEPEDLPAEEGKPAAKADQPEMGENAETPKSPKRAAGTAGRERPPAQDSSREKEKGLSPISNTLKGTGRPKPDEAQAAKHANKDDEDDDQNGDTTVSSRVSNVKDSNIYTTAGDIYQYFVYTDKIEDTIALKKLLGVDGREMRVRKPAPKNLEAAFKELDLLDQTYLIVMCFFEGMSSTDFEFVYGIVTNVLLDEIYDKKDRLIRTFRPAPELGKLKIVECNDPVRAARVYRFTQEDGGQIILDLVEKQYTNLLYKFVPAIKRVILDSRDNPEIRVFAAKALGRIANLNIRYVFETAVKELAEHAQASVRVTVAYLFTYSDLSEDTTAIEIQTYLRNTLQEWSDSPKWRLKWVAAAICEQYGLVGDKKVKSQAVEMLEKLAAIDDVRVAGAVMHALVSWSLQEKFSDSLELIGKWCGQGSAGKNSQLNPYQIRCVVALWAFGAVIFRNAELAKKKDRNDPIRPTDVASMLSKSQKNKDDDWSIMVNVGIRSFEFGIGNYFLALIEQLSTIMQNSDAFVRLGASWLEEVLYGLPPLSFGRQHILNRVRNVWLKGNDKTLKRLAQTIQSDVTKA